MTTLRASLFAALLLLILATQGADTRAAGTSRVTTYFCPPNCGVTYFAQVPITSWRGDGSSAAPAMAACASWHAMQYAHLVNIHLVALCGDWGRYSYFEGQGDPGPVDVYLVVLGEEYDYVWFSDSPFWGDDTDAIYTSQ